MTGRLPLDWALLAVSLFNTVVLLWLGLTVLLTAERRTWGVWLAGGGLLLGGGFFVSHTVLLGHTQADITPGLNFWWQAGWAPVIALPFAWYLVILWYSGYWDDPASALHRRQRPWLWAAAGLTAALAGLVLFGGSLPSLMQLVQFNLATIPALGGLPLLFLIYPAYIVLCIGLSLDALRQPGPTDRPMGSLARQRSRPWLAATSLVLLLVSMLVGLVMVWIFDGLRAGYSPVRAVALSQGVALFDLVIAGAIGVAVVLLGQAIVAYEVFTGQSLPRRGLARYWQRVVILAAGYGVVVGGALAFQLHPIYSLLLATGLMVVFFALLTWRSYAERERFGESLRPFLTSRRLYDRLVTSGAGPAGSPPVDASFTALCGEVLNTQRACLAPLGPLATLAGPALVYPPGSVGDGREAALPGELAAGWQANGPAAVALEPQGAGGFAWVLPLWSGPNLIGALLLGEKLDHGLYSHEEIELARAAGEQLLDTQASAAIAQRLMHLQRQRMAESQILDRRTRRTLHDEVLPRLHAAMLSLSAALPGGQDPIATEALESLAGVHRQIADLLRTGPAITAPEVARLGLVAALHAAVHQELAAAFEKVSWQVSAEAEAAGRGLAPVAAEVLFYAAREVIRNAARHGQAGGGATALCLTVTMEVRDNHLVVEIEDNGPGLAPGEKPDEKPGAGQGLVLHSTMLAILGGSLGLESRPGEFTRARLALPVNR